MEVALSTAFSTQPLTLSATELNTRAKGSWLAVDTKDGKNQLDHTTCRPPTPPHGLSIDS